MRHERIHGTLLVTLLAGMAAGAGAQPPAAPARPIELADAPPLGARGASFLSFSAAPDEPPEAEPEPAPKPVEVAVYWQNDGTILKRNNPTDRHYTNGNALTITHRPQWARELAAHVPFREDFDPRRTAGGYLLGHQMFTPRQIESRQLIQNDRPYAGYLYGGGFWQRANATTHDHLELNLGLVGPSTQAEELQKIIHDWSGGKSPSGWEHQLGDEPTVQTFLRRTWRVSLTEPLERPRPARGFGAELLPHTEMALGTVRLHAEAGVTARVGLNLPDDFGPGHLRQFPDATGKVEQGFSSYVFATAAGRGVAHDIFLDGNVFEGSHSVDAEPWVGRFRAGLSTRYRRGDWNLSLIYGQTFLTRQFERQDSGDAYGELRLAITHWF